jgi:isoprenylcysteine carboxyl methyltransferase (ICMT) family protein YpbQ
VATIDLVVVVLVATLLYAAMKRLENSWRRRMSRRDSDEVTEKRKRTL